MNNSSRCPYCGAPVSPSANYCDSCGTPLKTAPSAAPARRRGRTAGRVAVWVFALVIVALFGTGVLGGFRVHAGRWPWNPAEAATAGPADPNGTAGGTEPGDARTEPLAASPEQYLRATVTIQVRGAQGSRVGTGFLIDTGGHIVTNAHVVDGYRECVTVIDDNGNTHQGAVVGADRNRDVALITVPTLARWPDALALSDRSVEVGEQVFAWGRPKGSANRTMLPAEIVETGLSRRIEGRYYADLVAFRGAEVTHGSSGGPLLDPETGEYNLTYLRQYLPETPVRLVTWVFREQGLLVAKGNPKGLKGLADLARPDVRFINRQRGAGTRVMLDYQLRQLGIDPGQVRGYEQEEYTHLAVAAAVASGRADAGLGVTAAAQALDIDFVPLFKERYDLVIPCEHLTGGLLDPLFDLMLDERFRAAVAALPGYDVYAMGEVVLDCIA